MVARTGRGNTQPSKHRLGWAGRSDISDLLSGSGSSSNGLSKRLSGLAFLIVVAMIASSWVSLDATRVVSDRADELVTRQIPELREIAALDGDLRTQLLEMYLYYATMLPAHWDRYQAANASFMKRIPRLVALRVPLSQSRSIERLAGEFDRYARLFHAEMRKQRGRDWDLLREYLADGQLVADELSSLLQGATTAVRVSVGEGGKQTLVELARLNRVQTTITMVILVVGVFALSLLRSRLKDQEIIFERAYTDGLTGLPNRHRMEEDLPAELRSGRLDRGATFLLLNLDRFQMLTGTFGHSVGDGVVLAMSDRLQSAAASRRWKSRLYQFAPATWLIVVENPRGIKVAETLAKSVLGLTERPLTIGEREISVSLSVGVTHYPDHNRTLVDLLRNADSALREAQSSGGNTISVYDRELKNRTEKFLSTESALRHALERNEFELHYQPKLRSHDFACIGAEALIRWRRHGELVPPGAFIPIAEESGLILAIGKWVLMEACRQWKAFESAGIPPVPVAVNVSAQQFSTPGFADQVAEVLLSTGIPPKMLELEVTEEATFGDPDRVVSTLAAIREMGVHIAIDDFGTGYSSLSYLTRYPIDVIKIDRQFVCDLETSRQHAQLVDTIVALAHSLNFQVVAEGVETHRQCGYLQNIGCDMLQGMLFSKPVPADQFSAFLTRNALEAAPRST